jgi:hypothetical protein
MARPWKVEIKEMAKDLKGNETAKKVGDGGKKGN